MQPVKHNFKPLMIKNDFQFELYFETQCAKAILVLTSSKTWQAAVYFAPKHKHPPSEVEKMQNLKRCRLQNQPKPLILLSIHIGSRLPLCSRKNGKCKRSCFSRSIFWTIFPTMTFIFFSQYHSVCQRWTFFRRVIISKNQGDLLENTNWSFLVRSLGWKQFFISFFVCRNHFCIICYLLIFSRFSSTNLSTTRS